MKYISTGEYFFPDEWALVGPALIDKKKERALPEDLLKKLRNVREFRQKIENFENALLYQEKRLTFEVLDNFLRKSGPESFNDFCQAQVDADMSLVASTKRTHQNTINKLTEYKPWIKFDQVNYSLIEGFDNFLRKKGLNLNSIQGHHKRLGKYITIAIRKDQVEKNPYQGFKIKGQETVRAFLLMEEIEKIENADYSEYPMINRIKDLFLFGCFTGLRFSDLMNLSADHLEETSKGIAIRIRQQKVNTTVYLPLYSLFNGKAIPILQKYIAEGQGSRETVFQAISNQKANQFLKFIQHDLEMAKNLSMHTARHTFGTQIAARTNDPYLVSKLMGHRDLKSSLVYVHMAEQITDKKLEKIEW
jgi:site-specific recombinase XerD